MNHDNQGTAVRNQLQPVGDTGGSLAAVALYGLLFALGWLGIFCFAFVPQGIPLP